MKRDQEGVYIDNHVSGNETTITDLFSGKCLINSLLLKLGIKKRTCRGRGGIAAYRGMSAHPIIGGSA